MSAKNGVRRRRLPLAAAAGQSEPDETVMMT
jgi:hypothetical protein